MRAIAPLLLLLAPLAACDFPSLTYAGGGGAGGADDGSAGSAPCAPPADTSDCDNDGDGWLALRCCGEDCDDTDPEAFPGQTETFARPRNADGKFDFDCDGLEEPDPTQLFEGVLVCEFEDCTALKMGYASGAECGQIKEFYRCMLNATAICSAVPQDTASEPLRCN